MALGLLAAACAAQEPQSRAASLLEEAERLRTQGNARGAIPIYEESIELDPEVAAAYLGLAISYSNLGNDEEAERYYLLADTKGPEDVQVKLNLSGFYYRRREYDRAAWALGRAMDVAPEGNQAALISSLWARVETAQVRTRVRQGLISALAEDPDDDGIAARLAESYAKEAEDLLQGGNASEAIGVVQEGFAAVPDAHQAELYYVGAQAHGALGDRSSATEWVFSAIELDDTVPAYHLSLAGLLMEVREFDEALVKLDKVVELAPDSEEAEFARLRREDIERIKNIPEDELEEYLRSRRGMAPPKKKDPGGR